MEDNTEQEKSVDKSVENRIEKVEEEVEEVVEEVDIIVSDKLQKLQETLDSIVKNFSSAAPSVEKTEEKSVVSDAKELDINPEKPKDVTPDEEKPTKRKRTLRRKYR